MSNGYADLISRAEQIRQRRNYPSLVSTLNNELAPFEGISLKENATVAQAMLGLSRIAYVAGTAELKNNGPLDPQLELFAQKIYEQALSSDNLPLTDIQGTPTDWRLEIVRDQAGRIEISDPRNSSKILNKLIQSTSIPQKPDRLYDEKSPEWQKYLGTLSALSAIFVKLGREEKDLGKMKQGLETFLRIFSYPVLQNTERLTSLSLWTAELAVKQKSLNILLLSATGLIRAFFTNPQETSRIVITAIKKMK